MLYETDLDGNTVDSFILDIPELQGQSGLHVIDDGEYILGGTLSGQHSLREKGFVWRYSMEEDSIIWSHTFQNTNTNYETMVRFIEGRGDTVFVGGYGPSLWDDIHSFVKAMGVDGEVYWSREYQEDDTFLDAHLLPDGIAVVGGRGRFGIAEGQMVIKKLSFAGEELWARTYDFPGRAIANGITGTPDSGMMLCGWASGAGPVLLKIDQDGDLVWSRIIESAAGESIDGAGQDLYVSADRITCVGWTFDPAEGHKSLIIQTDAEGLLVENKTVELPAAHPLKVFPNPATSNIFVDLPTHIRWEDIVAEVHASDGRLVLQQNGAAARNGIEAGLLTPGFYYLSIRLLESGRLMGTASFVKE
jgi:outer membrane protein assembly factor BamB